MKKNQIWACAALLAAGLSFNACSDILDQDPLDSFTDAAVWGDLALAEAFLNDCYQYTEGENQNGVLYSNYTDESYHMHGYGTETYTTGLLTPDRYNIGWTEGKGEAWRHYYSGIKGCNMLLERIADTPAHSEREVEWKDEIIGQAHFLRAFYYHYLYGLYGRVPIIDHTFAVDAEFNETRADMDAVADFIVADCDKAASLLPVRYHDDSDFGRATRGAALALKGRVLLWKASPLFGTPSTEKWKAAADANKAVIDLGAYSLQSVSNSNEYADLFFDMHNPEVIFEKLYDLKGISGSSASLVMQAPAGPGNGYGGWSTWQPTYEIVEKFQNADGTPYVPTPTHKERVFVVEFVEATGEWVAEYRDLDVTTENRWQNREIRLDANIFYDGMMWGYGDSYRPIELFESGAEYGVIPGKDSRTGESWWNGTKTGYNMKKFLNPHFDFWGTDYDDTPWFFIRLAEVYLNYAECMIELGRDAEALKYINLVRNRALLPDATGQDIRAEYEYERQIELLFEGQRFFDLRRWKRMEATYAPENWPTALKIYKMEDGRLLYHHRTEPVQKRKFVSPQNYWLPVPRSELRKNPNLDAAPYE